MYMLIIYNAAHSNINYQCLVCTWGLILLIQGNILMFHCMVSAPSALQTSEKFNKIILIYNLYINKGHIIQYDS